MPLRFPLALFGLWLAVVIALQFASCRNGAVSWENLTTDVKYTGPQACQSCHAEIFDSYRKTGMGRSWHRPSKSDVIEDFGPNASVFDPHSNFHYRPYWQGDSMYVLEYRLEGRDTVHRRAERVDYVVGSGHQTRSYVLERNGFLYEAPITWYVSRKIWDLSPGYHDGHNSRFDRALGTECVHCHNAYADPVPGTVNRYRRVPLGIDCERCHGPGALHVERMQRDEIVDVGKQPDYSIVNPAKLPVELQFDVCQQCHLQGVNVDKTYAEFRPAKRLGDVREVFLAPPADESQFGIASHAARLRQSACFLQSKGRLTCTSCHNPHVSIREQPAEFHRKSCQNCHAQGNKSCTAPQGERAARQDQCATCHMPKGGTSDIPHVQFTDHFIRKNPILLKEKAAPESATDPLPYVRLLCATNDAPDRDAIGEAWLLYYERHESRPEYLKHALESLADTSYFALSRVHYYQGKPEKAEELARKAAERLPDDALRQFHWAQTLEALQRHGEALSVYLRLFQANASLAEAANRAATLLLKTRQGQTAALYESEKLLLKAAAEQPHRPETYANLGFVYLNLRDYARAQQSLSRALYLNPDHAVALENLILLKKRQGQADSAALFRKRLAMLKPKA